MMWYEGIPNFVHCSSSSFSLDAVFGNFCFDYIIDIFEYMKPFKLFPLWSYDVNVNPLKLVTWIFNYIFVTDAFIVFFLDVE